MNLRCPPQRLWVTLLACLCAPSYALAAFHVVIVEGLGGESVYAEQFRAQVDLLRTASTPLLAGGAVRAFTGESATREAVQNHLRGLAKTLRRDDRLAVYLIGHGSFDGQQFKFNVPGPDLTGEDIARLLDALPTDNQLVVSTASASGALADVLKKDSRILITATRSGNERNATRFGADFAQSLKDPAADTDKNGNISAQEAFDFASRRVTDFFERETRIASEHPRIEGQRASRFTVAQLVAATQEPAGASPERTRLIEQRDAVNARIEELRLRREQMPEAEYLSQLEALLLELANAEEALEKGQGNNSQGADSGETGAASAP